MVNMVEKRRVVVIAGSKNDIKKNGAGLLYLKTMVVLGVIEVVGIHVRSIHRHPEETRKLVKHYSDMHDIDVIIAEAGKAADLPGGIDAYLRNEFKDYKIVVIGVGLPGETPKDELAAELSITEIPGTQVVYAGQRFLDGCVIACSKELPKIKVPKIPAIEDFTLDEVFGIVESD